jgi:4'-phosphopantetheinyl transferase
MIDPCEVYWADPVLADSARRRLLRLLSDDERRRWAQSRSTEDRARYLAAHALARIVLAGRVGVAPESLQFTNECERCGRPHGRPRLLGANPPVHISLAHSGRRVAIAVASRSPVGIDVEEVTTNREILPLIHEALSTREREAMALVACSARTRAFLRYWTRKEAILKATGHGLAIAPNLVTVSAHDAPAALVAWDAEDKPDAGVSLRDLELGPEHVGCVAALGDIGRVATHDARARLGSE